MSLAAQNVIGSLLIDPAAYWRIAEIVAPDDIPQEHRALFVRIVEAVKANETFDAIVADDEGFEAAIGLASASASSASIVGWAKSLADKSETRAVRDAGRRIALCETYGEAQEVLAAVRPEQMEQVKTVQDGLTEFVATLQARYDANSAVTGVPTGMDSLDVLTAGWQPGNLIVLVGETSMGKSALALQSAIAAAQYGATCGKSALYFSLEMTVGELTERAVSHLADFPMAWMTHPTSAPDYAMDRVTEGSKLFDKLPLMFDDRCGLTLEQVVSRSIQVHMNKPLCAIFVDYMHIMGRPRRNDVSELGGIAAGLKNLSKTLNVPVIALHQLNRSNSGQRPTLSDVRASGEIAEAANTVIAIYRSEVANPTLQRLHGYTEVLIRKQRQGRRDVRAWAKSKIGNMRFESCDPPEGYDENITVDAAPEGSSNVRPIQARRKF